MKIIGKTETGYLAELTKGEIKSILSKNDSRKSQSELKIGDELTFTSALERLTILKDLSLTDNYKSLYKLIDAREELDKAIQIIKAANDSLIIVKREVSQNTEV